MPIETSEKSEKKDRMPQPDFVMPRVRLGDQVMWFNTTITDAAFPGVVVRVGDRCIDLLLFLPNSIYNTPRNGARHWTDPRLKTMRIDPTDFPGVWANKKEWLRQNQLDD